MVSSVAGNYRLGLCLGQGTFASVYLGEHVHLKTQAAIKILRTNLWTFDASEFLQEAKTIANFEHQHIVRVLEFGFQPDNTTPYLVMKYAAHGSLRQRYPRGTRLAPTDILPYLKQLAEALTYTHKQKVVHCDIKPENILLDEQDRLLLADFGIAKLAHQREQNIRGTPLYMAPEQIQGHSQPASDQYALAVVVYEWLCGQCPFPGSTSEEIRNKHLHMPPPPLRQFVPTLSPKIEQVVLQALAKDPKGRFQDIKEFVTKFEEATYTFSTAAKRGHVIAAVHRSLDRWKNRQNYNDQNKLAARLLANRYKSTLSTSQESDTITPTEPASPDQRDHVIISTPYAMPRIDTITPPNLVSLGQTNHIAMNTLPATPGIDTILPTELASPNQPNITTSTLPATPGIDTILPTELASPSRIKRGETLYELNFGLYNAVRTLAWSSDGQTLAAGCDNHQIFTWDALTGQNKREHVLHRTQVRSIVWSPTSRLLASACAKQLVHIWNPDEQHSQPIMTFYGYVSQTAQLGLACTLAWSPNGQLLASGGNDHTARIWRAKDGIQLSQCVGHTNDINALCWSPDNHQVATASDDGSIRLWDIHTGQPCAIWNHHPRQVYTLGWSYDSTLLASGGEGKTVYLWDPTETNQPHYKIYDKHACSIYTLSWSPNSLLLATAGRDSIVHIWDANSRTLLLPYQGHNKLRLGSSRSVLALAWSPDGKYIASSDDDGIVQVWRAVD